MVFSISSKFEMFVSFGFFVRYFDRVIPKIVWKLYEIDQAILGDPGAIGRLGNSLKNCGNWGVFF